MTDQLPKYLVIDPQNPQSLFEAQEMLALLVLPWTNHYGYSAQFIRVNGLGKKVAVCCPGLGGFGNTDGSDGWGYKSCPDGQGSSISGIAPTKAEAMARIDAFLAENYKKLTVLTPVEEGAEAGKATCENPKEAHRCYGTGNTYSFKMSL